MSRHDPGLTLEQIIQFCQEGIELAGTETYEGMMADRYKRYAFERIMECGQWAECGNVERLARKSEVGRGCSL